MTDPVRLDTAAALSRTPLFSHLGRLDLARLAGELEERRYATGQVIVREGDLADGFYVIKSGTVEILAGGAVPDPTGPAGDGQPITTLGPGEVFGEMALLTDSRRTATVTAKTDATVWRLSRARFETLLGQERGIARSIERSLSVRLAAASHEAAALRAVSERLARGAVRRLGPEARRLLAGLGARPRWDAEALRRTCGRTGCETALAELLEVGILRVDGARATIDPAVLAAAEGASPDPAWLRAAAEDLAAAGDVVAATDLGLAAGAAEYVEGLLGAHESRLLEHASPDDLDRWLAAARQRAPSIESRLSGLRARLVERPAATVVTAGTRERRAPLFGRLARGLATTRALSAALSVAAYALAWTLPTPEGLERAGMVALGGIVATVPLLVANVLPDYVVMLLLTLGLVLPGLVPAPVALGGFAAPAWMMILTLLAVGNAVSRSGLMFRLVLLSLRHLPPRFVPQSLVLCATGICLTAGLTSGSTRIALGVPIARGITDAMGFAPRSPGAAAVGLMTFFTFLQVGELFPTGTFTGLVVHDLLPPAARAEITWWRWFFIALPPFVFITTATYLSILFLFRPHREGRVNLEAVRLQQAVLGPLTRNEVWSAVVLLALVLGFASRPYHGIAPAWLALAGFLFLFVIGTLEPAALQGGGTLGLLVYSGVILSLGGVFGALRIDAWLTAMVQQGMPAIVRNPYGFVLAIAIVAFLLHFFVPWMTASTILALVAMPIAEGLGFHPFVPVLVALIAGDHTILPYVNSGYIIMYFASEGELFTHSQARWPLILETAFRLLALMLSVPVWQLMGLM